MNPDLESRLHALLCKALTGDERAYTSFLHLAAKLVRTMARRKLAAGPGPDTEDVVQETLLAIHLKRQTWRKSDPVTPWLFAIARHKVIDAFRRRGRRIMVNVDDFADILAAPEVEFSSEREVGKALDGLSGGQRRVVEAISVEGLSIGETAARFGMKEATVRVALHRGLATIAARFGQNT